MIKECIRYQIKRMHKEAPNPELRRRMFRPVRNIRKHFLEKTSAEPNIEAGAKMMELKRRYEYHEWGPAWGSV